MKKLPIGIQTFSKIRDKEENYYYIDKTDIAYKLIKQGSYYFLSRPRRFGKSLFLDTLSEIFKANKQYFEGLYIYDKWDWSTSYPVIKISFGSGDFSSVEGITRNINYNIEKNIKLLNIKFNIKNEIAFDINFNKLIQELYNKNNQKVVILIDEYDKPILDNITNREVALKARNILKNFYSAIKDNDEYIKFVFITGVSKFSKMNLFSGLNNLEDITINSNYATITGYTHNDLKEVFKDRLDGVDLDLVKKWYNGYNYFGEPIYNPFDILLFLSNNCKFSNYWWETGNPSFLIKMLKKGNYYLPNLEEAEVGKETLNAFDVDQIDIVALLWQTGYLTFDKEINLDEEILYKMKIPNKEIQTSLNFLFLDYLSNLNAKKTSFKIDIKRAINSKDFKKVETTLKSLFASIPNNNYISERISKVEGYYASVIYTFLLGLGYDAIAEDTTNTGRIDLTLKTNDIIIVIEFKVDAKNEDAIQQIKEKKYYQKYFDENKDIYLVGINFDSQERNIKSFEYELLER